jgi:hypothetical protein
MSDESNKARDGTQEGSPSKEGEPSSFPTTHQADTEIAEAKLERIIEKLPPDQVQHTIRELIFGIIERGASTKADPDALKIAAASVDKDNEFKFRFLTQKETNKADQDKRTHELKEKDHALKVKRYEAQHRMLWPILISVIVLVLGCISAGIYLAATGRETLGFSILSATISSVFAFFGGWGMAHFFKND